MRFAFNPFTRALDVVDVGGTGSGPIFTLTGNSGGAITPDVGGNINLTGTSPVTVAGNLGTNTLAISVGDATTLVKGIASFNATNFSVAAGAVSSQNFTITAGTGLTGGGAITLGGSVTLNATGGGLPTSVQGDIFYASGVDTVTTLAKDTNTTRYLSNTGVTNNPAWAQVALSTGVSGQLPLANGGTNANLTASNGGIFYSTATAGAILSGTATAGQILRSGASGAPTWSTATYPATAGTTGNLLTSDGTNWVSSAFTNTPTTTYTPVLSFGNGTTGITYTTQRGRYAQVGNVVTYSIELLLSSKGSSTGSARITLPIATAATILQGHVVAFWSGLTLTANYTTVAGYSSAVSTQIELIINGSAQSSTAMNDTMFANTSYIILNGSYLV